MSKTQQVSEPISQHDEDEPNEPEQSQAVRASWAVKLMIGYLYFAQGFVLSISSTTPYIYPELPDYFTLSLFSLSSLPFSLKFITAPLLEKYSNLNYGKRKTWIMVSQIGTLISIILCSFFTDLSQAHLFATISFFIYFFLSMQDISLDALCLKQLENAKVMSMLQAGCQSSGIIIGGLILLKPTSLQFAQSIGLDQPICSYQTVLICFCIFLLGPTFLIHFLFQQKHIQAEIRSTKQSILKVYSIYKYFFKKDYRYFRIMVYFIFYYQGLNFYLAGYSYQLIKKGFSKNLMNTFDNLQNAVITALVFLIGTKAKVFGLKKTFIFEVSLNLIVTLYLWIFFPTSAVPVFITNFILNFLIQWDFMLMTQLCAYFPEIGATGMLFTMSASWSNLGKNNFIHTAILKKLPWRPVGLGGLILQVPLTFIFIPKMMDLIDEGETRIVELENPSEGQKQLQEKEDVNEVKVIT